MLILIRFHSCEMLMISFSHLRNSHHKVVVHSVFLTPSQETNDHDDIEMDTVRVRIWRALSKEKEMTLRELGIIVGESNIRDLKFHLLHVEKQAKTLGNKSDEWKIRRNISPEIRKAKLAHRRGQKGLVYIKMDY